MSRKVKETLAVIALGGILSIIPFYYQTNAMTIENKQNNEKHALLIEQTKQQIHSLELKGAVEQTKINQLKESLDRIEQKIDRLMENKVSESSYN